MVWSTLWLLLVAQTRPFVHTKHVSIIGSGSWATTMARHVANLIEERKDLEYEPELRLWALPEEFQGRNITDWINIEHENPKYLPGYPLSPHIIASSSMEFVCKDADIICFIVPHQFADSVLHQMKPFVKPTSICISLTKGLFFDTAGPCLISDTIQSILTLSHVAVLMGANVANDVAAENFVESTLACKNLSIAASLRSLFETSNFRIELSADIAGVELCGALKNIIALGVGFCEGMDIGVSTKGAIITQGLKEMILFNKLFAPNFQVSGINRCYEEI